MDVILLERVEKLGKMGEIVRVRPGYARNYLLPQKKAVRATEDNLARFEEERAQLETANETRRDEAQRQAEQHEGLSVVLIRQAGEAGQLYGSVSTRDIADAVSAVGPQVRRQQIPLDNPIKAVGLYQVPVALHPEVILTVTVNVARSQDEADVQIRIGGPASRAAEMEEEEDFLDEELEHAAADEADSGADADREPQEADAGAGDGSASEAEDRA
jgi:large subunit ribosomal protein L9